MDLIKGILIIFIIITHYNWTDEQRRMMLFPYWIDMAVPVFMIISGYVYALSYKRKKITSLKDAYEYKEIASKLIRYSVPLLMAFTFEVFLYVISGIKIDLSCVLTGGIGPGSFYYPVMIQFVFVYPLIYFAIKEYDLKGLCICGIANIVFEIAKAIYEMPTSEYRFLVLRYILLIATGCYLAIGKQRIRRPILYISMLIGIFWQYAVYYLNYKPVIINETWATTSCISALYIIPICVSVFSSKKMMDIRFGLLELIGRASFNIFLTQMVYFVGAKVIYKAIQNIWISNLVNILICCVVGIVFYMIESRITKGLLHYFDKKNYFEKRLKKISKKIGHAFKDKR
ncbi:MAG: acyltransferase family protein [Erysipelotrichaceae bacterium]|nr:acyltransferase family protein [Erysipelotrichaceae bacterium]